MTDGDQLERSANNTPGGHAGSVFDEDPGGERPSSTMAGTYNGKGEARAKGGTSCRKSWKISHG